MSKTRFPFVAAVLAAVMAPVWCQGLTGQISGLVRDQSGSVVVNAAVELIDGTGQRRPAITDGRRIPVSATARGDVYPDRQRAGIREVRGEECRAFQLGASRRSPDHPGTG